MYLNKSASATRELELGEKGKLSEQSLYGEDVCHRAGNNGINKPLLAHIKAPAMWHMKGESPATTHAAVHCYNTARDGLTCGPHSGARAKAFCKFVSLSLMILGPREVVHDPLSKPDGHTLFRLDVGVEVVVTVGHLSHNLTCSFPSLSTKQNKQCSGQLYIC